MEYMVHLFNAGGAVMYPLIFFMLGSWTIMFERVRVYRKIQDEISTLKVCIQNVNRDWSQLVFKIHQEDAELLVFIDSIVESTYNLEGLENRLHDVVAYMDGRLKRGLHWLNMMVTMAPLLGLLGTVVGMIRSFAAVGSDIGAPTVITGGVSEALIATGTGLTVAIIALAFYSWCSAKVNDHIATLEQNLGSIIDIYNRSQMK